MSDLYEQKYLKYRRKYIELKNQLNGGSSHNTLTKYDSNNSGLRNFLIKYGGASQNTLTKYDSNNTGLRDFLIKYGGANPAVPAVEIITIEIGKK